MATRAIKPKRDDTMLTGWQTTPERAPSVMLEAKPTFTRFLFMVGLLLCAIGSLALLAVEWKFNYVVGPSWGQFCLMLGLGLILVHAFSEKEEQFRRMYAVTGLLILCVSAGLRVLHLGGAIGGRFIAVGLPGLVLGLLLFGSVLRHETDAFWRRFLSRVLLIFAAGILAGGIIEMNLYRQNFLGEGTLLMILGLFFALTAITYQNEDVSYKLSLGLGALGLFCIGLGLIRSIQIGSDFVVPSGFTLIGMGLLYLVCSLGAVADWPYVVLTRRELATFFYSPIAYPVFAGMVVISFLSFNRWLQILNKFPNIPEPIVEFYFLSLIPVIAQIFLVPILTMRLLSEEKRSGTLEVLLTAPVKESSVVLSKFTAILVVYLLVWTPMWIYAVALRQMGGEPFDYRPLMSFFLALTVTGAGFMAMGLFFSSVTRNQIVAAILAFAGMMAFLSLMLFKDFYPAFQDLFSYISYLDLWQATGGGLISVRHMLVHVSLAVFFLYLTIKVLEARKWK